MVNRVSTSGAAFLACLAGCLASVNPAAVAGDKIEFSSAPDALAVPQSVRSVRQDPAAMIRETLARHHTEGSDFNGAASGNYVGIVIPATTAKSHDHFGWTAPFEHSEDEESDSSFDLFPARKSSSAATNSNNWSISADKDSGFIAKDGIWAKDTPLRLNPIAACSIRRRRVAEVRRAGRWLVIPPVRPPFIGTGLVARIWFAARARIPRDPATRVMDSLRKITIAPIIDSRLAAFSQSEDGELFCAGYVKKLTQRLVN